MSLNFVSTTVLSSTDGVSHDTETRLASSDATSISRSENYKPLYEQLRQNAQEEQEKYDEVTKAMRGTRALDDEDVAHLQSLEDERAERLRLQALREHEELESFRLAKLDYKDANKPKGDTLSNHNTFDNNEAMKNISVNSKERDGQDEQNMSSLMKLKPKIIVTKKRRRKELSATSSEDKSAKKRNDSESEDKKHSSEENEGSSNIDQCGLGGLIGGYGSSDSDD